MKVQEVLKSLIKEDTELVALGDQHTSRAVSEAYEPIIAFIRANYPAFNCIFIENDRKNQKNWDLYAAEQISKEELIKRDYIFNRRFI